MTTRFRPPRTVCTALSAAAALTVGMLVPGAAFAAFPEKPVTVVVTFAPGGNVDATARALAPALSRALGQPVVVENRAGGGGTIGAAHVARARPDGYTLMLGSTATNATGPALVRTAGYDGVKSFTIVGGVSITPSVVVVTPTLPATSYRQLLELSKRRAQGVSAGSPGTGSLNHLTLEVLKIKTGLNATHVPYRGAGPALADLAGGQIDAMVDQLSSSLQLVRDGRLRAIAQTGARRSRVLPDVPTLREQGINGVDVAVYTGFFAPAGLPRDVQDTLWRALRTALDDTAVQQRLTEQGSERIDGEPSAFARHVEEEARYWSELIRNAGITAEN